MCQVRGCAYACAALVLSSDTRFSPKLRKPRAMRCSTSVVGKVFVTAMAVKSLAVRPEREAAAAIRSRNCAHRSEERRVGKGWRTGGWREAYTRARRGEDE